MRRRRLYRGIALALALGLLTAPAVWSAPQRDTGPTSWALGWLDRLGGWLAGMTTAIGSSQDCGAGIDPDGAATSSPAEGGDEGSGGDRGPGIDPDG